MAMAWLIGCGGWKSWGLPDGLLALMLAQWQSEMLLKLSALALMLVMAESALSGSEQNWVAPPGRRRPLGLAGAGSGAIPAWAIDSR